MPTPSQYWRSHEQTRVTSLGSLTRRLQTILEVKNAADRKWVFRGVADESYGLHSSLSRLWWNRHGKKRWPTEAELSVLEGDVLEHARSWKLDRHRSGPLSGLELLASLQHTRAPTRLIDVTHHALAALWYAAEKHDDRDGRVFALEVSTRELPRHQLEPIEPFWRDDATRPVDWESEFWVWTPPPFEERIARQHGAFLIGGVPRNSPQQWYLSGQHKEPFGNSQVLGLVSIAARANKGGRGRPANRPMRTFRIAKEAKAKLRRQLDVLFDLSPRTLFPDLTGFEDEIGKGLLDRPPTTSQITTPSP